MPDKKKKSDKTKKKLSFTTIAVDHETRAKLESMKQGREDVGDVVERLAAGQIDVYVEFILVDNELARTHTALFQLGEDVDSLYFFDGGKCNPIKIEDAQKLTKNPNPNITFTKEEALTIREHFPKFDLQSVDDEIIYKKLDDFLTEKPAKEFGAVKLI